MTDNSPPPGATARGTSGDALFLENLIMAYTTNIDHGRNWLSSRKRHYKTWHCQILSYKGRKIGKKVARVRRCIKSRGPPTAEELQKFSKERATDIEVEALDAQARPRGQLKLTDFVNV